MKRSTIGDVAAAAGVSVATVSRVLNGGNVKEATASRVWEVVTRLEYTPNALTKSIFAGRSSTIGAVIDDLSSPFYLDLMRGIDEVAAANGSLVTFSSTFRHGDREIAQVQTMDEQRVRGLVVTTGTSTDDKTRRMAAGGTPCVIVARSVPNPPPRLHSVSLDHIAAGWMMAEHLISCGRRRIGVISSGTRPSQFGRIEGLRSGLDEAGLSLPEEAVVDVATKSEVGEAVWALLERSKTLDALVCLTGRYTVAVHSALADCGLAIPDDIGFLSMDDFSWGPALGITVVAQPSYQMGRRAAELIVGNSNQSAQLTFEPKLVVRTSCGESSAFRTSKLPSSSHRPALPSTPS
ncbi:LacI family DNA-binding transcriptional regulator [Rhodococcus sp. A14]|uniref:substrate-binding domain-containing protein n=1 Tax=Rhodococcus sp. A14 TaxID=1194106 RepID=UPI00142348AE|nr:LacI family transcriptional regulator [Rhodococcus sp. A14]